MQTQRGFSLLEVLIAAVIGLIMTTAVLTSYLQLKNHVLYQQAQQDLLSRGQLAVYLLRHAIQQAGDIGCAHLTANTITPLITAQNYLQKITLANKKPTTDAIQVRHITQPRILLRNGAAKNSTQLNVNPNKQIKQGTWLLSDCVWAEIVNVKGQNNLRIQLKNPLQHRYNFFATLSRLTIETYFIRDTKRRNARGEKIYALYVKNDITKQTEELIPGVTQLQFTQADRMINIDLSVQVEIRGSTQRPLTQTWHIVEGIHHA